MFLALDIIVVVIFAATVINCMRRGFILSAMDLLKSILAVGAAYIFAPALADFFKDAFLNDAITAPVRNRLDVMLSETAGKFNIEKLFSDKPGEFVDILSRYGVDIEDFSDSWGSISQASADQVAQLAQDITASVVNTVSYILAFVALLVAALIVLTVVIVILSAVVKLPIIKGADRLLGTVFGVVSGFVLAFALSLSAKVGFEALASVKPEIFDGVIEKTIVVKFLGELKLSDFLIK